MENSKNYSIQCKNVKKRYKNNHVLTGMNLEICKGQIVGLLGPNGSGKTTLIKLLSGLLQPDGGELLIEGMPIGIDTKRVVSYLPERTYLSPSLRILDALALFQDFYEDFQMDTALSMLETLKLNPKSPIKTLSKGNREKVQLILVMSRQAKLYLLDEPMGGVDPAARDFILKTILANYNPEASVIISTHLIGDVEKILDDIVFIQNGNVILHQSADALREERGKSVDAIFREVFAC